MKKTVIYALLSMFSWMSCAIFKVYQLDILLYVGLFLTVLFGLLAFYNAVRLFLKRI